MIPELWNCLVENIGSDVEDAGLVGGLGCLDRSRKIRALFAMVAAIVRESGTRPPRDAAMAHDGLIEFVRGLAVPVRYTRATDRELLAQFTDSRDQVAFEALVRRYARQVRSAAAQVLTDRGDIDDAVQATYLVLVRRAARKDWRD